MVCKLPKKLYFLQFSADLSKKSKSTKAIYIYASERSRYALSEIGVVYYAVTYCFRGMSVWSRSILKNFCWVSIFSDILISNISWMVAQTPINHSIFWKSVMRTFRCIYVNCFNNLAFLLRSAENYKEFNFFGNLQTITQVETWKLHKWHQFFQLIFPL